MRKILIIAFDGLHRSGKGTQISLLQKKLFSQNIFSLVARGDGTRRGTGSSPFDYPSKWWRNNFSYFQEKHSYKKEVKKMNMKYQKLNREINHFKDNLIPGIIKKEKYSSGVLILDRCYVSRYFTMRNLLGKVSIKDAIKCYNPKNKRQIKIVKPNLTFILHGPKDILLERLEKTTKDSHDLNFKKNIIQKHYSLFDDVVKELDMRNSIEVIDFRESPKEISKYINKKTKTLLK